MSCDRKQMRRTLAGVTAAFIVSVAVTLAVAGTAAAASSLFVSTTGSDSNPCTSAQPCKTIGHAVALAGPGSMISVAAGTYTEEVVIGKRLSLIGQNAVVDASGHDNGIVLNGAGAAGSLVKGFTVENANAEGILAVSTFRVSIVGNELMHNDKTPGAASPQQCANAGNVPGDCGEALHLMGTSFSRVTGNNVHNNVGGILITDETGPSHGNVIGFNVSRDNVEDCGITLPSHNGLATTNPTKAGVYNNTIIGNLSQGNGGAGVGMFAPFPGTASYNNRVIGNRLLDNGEAGAAIHAHAPGEKVSGNMFIGNTISGNGVDPDADSGQTVGIALLNADPSTTPGVVIIGNRFSNSFYGIFINGSFSIPSPSSNFFAASVTVPVAHHA
jgi:nitrous oxidase accessory protein NosD